MTCYANGLVAAATAGAGTAAGTAAAASAGERLSGSDEEAHGAGVNSGAFADGFPQFLHAAESVAVLLHGEVQFVGVVQREADAGTAAAAGSEIHTDSRLGLVCEEGVEFGKSVFSKNKHEILR